MVHTLILAVLLYAIVRAALRGRQPDPMAGRLVPRGAFVPTQYQRDTVDEILRHAATLPNSLFESPDQMWARELRAKVAAPTICPATVAWHAEQDRLDLIDRQHLETGDWK